MIDGNMIAYRKKFVRGEIKNDRMQLNKKKILQIILATLLLIFLVTKTLSGLLIKSV